MRDIVKQVAGIDVAQKDLVICLGRLTSSLTVECYARKTFLNREKSFIELVNWVNKHTDQAIPIQYVMEATGVYHEALAYYLANNGQQVSIVLPKKINHYIKTLAVKTVTDKTSAEAIARFGLERKVDLWTKPNTTFKLLRQLTRERSQLMEETTLVKNRLHAESVEHEPNPSTIRRLKKRIKLLAAQVEETEADLQKMAKSDDQLKSSLTKMQSAPGIGLITAATMLAETNGYELIRNTKQITSFAGMDVQEKQSGTSVRGRTRISKKGNRYLRKALYFPALAAIRHDKRFKDFYNRLLAKHGVKMKALVAVQRKILELGYTLYKTNQLYDKDYVANQKNEEQKLIKNPALPGLA